MRKIYKYRITFDIDHLTLYEYTLDGYFVRKNREQNIYSRDINGENKFFEYAQDVNKIFCEFYPSEGDLHGYYEIYGFTEYEEGEEHKKYELKTLVKEKLKEVSAEKLAEINSFLKHYEEIIK